MSAQGEPSSDLVTETTGVPIFPEGAEMKAAYESFQVVPTEDDY